jgi:Peptidase propeptide and YPEB domain
MMDIHKIHLSAAIAIATAVLAPLIVNAEDPKEPAIKGTIQFPNEANKEAAQARLAKITIDQALTAALNRQSGTVLRAELQDEDGFLVYNVEIASSDNQLYQVKIDAGNRSVLRVDVDSSDRETEHESRAD